MLSLDIDEEEVQKFVEKWASFYSMDETWKIQLLVTEISQKMTNFQSSLKDFAKQLNKDRQKVLKQKKIEREQEIVNLQNIQLRIHRKNGINNCVNKSYTNG
jgi:hypothetical protein